MIKSKLIIGLQASGKTTKVKSLLSTYNTEFVLDAATTVEEIQNVLQQATEANSFCIVATQLKLKQIPLSVLSNFEIYEPSF